SLASCCSAFNATSRVAASFTASSRSEPAGAAPPIFLPTLVNVVFAPFPQPAAARRRTPNKKTQRIICPKNGTGRDAGIRNVAALSRQRHFFTCRIGCAASLARRFRALVRAAGGILRAKPPSVLPAASPYSSVFDDFLLTGSSATFTTMGGF